MAEVNETLDQKTLNTTLRDTDLIYKLSAAGVDERIPGINLKSEIQDGLMAESVYDPSTVAGDAFDMDNMVESATSKVLTDTERTKLAGIETSAQVNTVDSVNGQTGTVVLDAQDVLPAQAGQSGKFLGTDGSVSSWQTIPGGGTMSSFSLAGDSGTPQTIEDSNTLTVAGANGLETVAGATDTVTVQPTAATQTKLGYIDQDVKAAATPTFAGVQYTPGATPAYSEGLVFYDLATKTLNYYNDISDVVNNIGEETWFRVKNNTGITINNGQIVYMNGVDLGVPTVALANASNRLTCLATMGIATHDIANGAEGVITTIGTVRDLNTSACSPGDVLFLSATTDGAFTTVEPQSPHFSVRLGVCGTSDLTNGDISAHVTVRDNMQGVVQINNGLILEDHTTAVTSNGTTISLTLEKTGGGDLSLVFNSDFTIFDATPTASVNLTPGTDTAPVLNYVYIPQSTNTLTANTTGFPEAQHVPIATVYCQSAASAQLYGVYKWHAWTDHFTDANDQGHISHINKWIRSQNATWLAGAQVTPTVGAGVSDIAVTAGNMLQLHEHATAAFNTATGDDAYIVNDSVTPFKRVGDLTGELTDSLGGSMSGRRFSLVIWISSSEGSGNDKLMVNLPSGSYGTDATAIADNSNFTNYTIPPEFVGVGILLARITYQHQTAGGGTWSVIDTQDLRGSFPSGFVGGGGGGAVSSVFSDANFTIVDNADATKELKFEASGITTATTRTLTAQNKDYTIADQADVDLNTTHSGSDGKDHADVVLNNAHRVSTSNPHNTSIANIGNGTLAQLNSSVTDATLTGRDTADILTNKTIDATNNTITNINGAALASNTKIRAVTFNVSGAGPTITTGFKKYLPVSFSGTITQWDIIGDQTGSIVIDVWKTTYASAPPTVADTITGTEKPTLSSAQKNQDVSLSTWTTAITAGDVLAFNVDSVSTLTDVTLVLYINIS